MWTAKLRDNYDNDFEQFQAYAETYGLLDRLGFESCEDAWADNPMIQGSTNPADFGLVHPRFEHGFQDILRRDSDHPAHDKLRAEAEATADLGAEASWEETAQACDDAGRSDLASYVREFLAPGQ